MRQFALVHGYTNYIVWLEDDKRLQEGARVTLKDYPDPKKLWTIKKRYETVVMASELQKRWHVGGIK